MSPAKGSFWDFITPREQPNADEATREEVAQHCGIKIETAPPYAVPMDHYRAQGEVSCERTGRVPDPPFRVVCRYETPDGDWLVLSHESFSDLLQDQYPRLDENQALALALHRAGWLEPDFRGLDSPLGPDQHYAGKLIAEGKTIVNK